MEQCTNSEKSTVYLTITSGSRIGLRDVRHRSVSLREVG